MGKNINDKSFGGFVHLHLHSDYSILDSSLKISELVMRVEESGMSNVDLKDHGNILIIQYHARKITSPACLTVWLYVVFL